MSKYDYFISGRWRNRQNVLGVAEKLRTQDKSVYCFAENEYDAHGIKFDSNPEADEERAMAEFEALSDWQTNPTFRQIFEDDMNALKDSEEFVLVLPAGLSAHMELGVAYGLGKKCYGIGSPEKAETLYLMFDEIYADVEAFINAQTEVKV